MKVFDFFCSVIWSIQQGTNHVFHVTQYKSLGMNTNLDLVELQNLRFLRKWFRPYCPIWHLSLVCSTGMPRWQFRPLDNTPTISFTVYIYKLIVVLYNSRDPVSMSNEKSSPKNNCWNVHIAVKFSWRLDGNAVEPPTKFHSDWTPQPRFGDLVISCENMCVVILYWDAPRVCISDILLLLKSR